MSAGFDIAFDFRFDTTGFFDDPAARAALERAGEIWEDLIRDEFTDVPAGVSFTIQHPGPSTPGERVSVTLDQPIDDLLIFAGAQAPPFGTADGSLAAAGFAGNDAQGDLLRARTGGGQDVTRDFEPFAGNLSVDPTADWTFALDDPPEGKVDFVSVMLHEIGHILGFGQAPAFEGYAIEGQGSFAGANAVAVNGGPIPLASDLAHFVEDFAGNSTLMDPTARFGRTQPTDFDLAVLADIGLEVDGFETDNTIPPLATDFGDSPEFELPGIFGSDAPDILDGLGGGDQIFAGRGDDLVIGGRGDDTIWGGEGTDVFLIRPGDGADRINDFDVGEDVILLSAAFGFETVDEALATSDRPFLNVERLNLDGQTSIETLFASNSEASLSAANIRLAPDPGDIDILQDVAEVYVGYFGRAPDPVGLSFWAGQFETGLDEGRQRGRILEDISESFRLGGEAQALFPFLAPANAASADRAAVEGFVADVFDNLFNRTPDAAGLAFWADTIEARLDAGINLGDIIVDIASGAQDTEDFRDARTIANKATAARFYAERFAEAGAEWTLEDDGEGAREVVAGVTSATSSLSTAEARVGAYLAADQDTPSFALVGTSPDFDAAGV